MNSEYDRPRCPHCGRFVSDAHALANDERLISVTGACRQHNVVTLAASWWNYDLWFAEEGVVTDIGVIEESRA